MGDQLGGAPIAINGKGESDPAGGGRVGKLAVAVREDLQSALPRQLPEQAVALPADGEDQPRIDLIETGVELKEPGIGGSWGRAMAAEALSSDTELVAAVRDAVP